MTFAGLTVGWGRIGSWYNASLEGGRWHGEAVTEESFCGGFGTRSDEGDAPYNVHLRTECKPLRTNIHGYNRSEATLHSAFNKGKMNCLAA